VDVRDPSFHPCHSTQQDQEAAGQVDMAVEMRRMSTAQEPDEPEREPSIKSVWNNDASGGFEFGGE
jgi:hypothetical protein